MMSSISNVFKPSSKEEESTNIFSDYKKLQSLKKKAELEEEKKHRLEEKVSDLKQEIQSLSEKSLSSLSEKIHIPAADLIEFLKSNFHKIKQEDYEYEDFESSFFRWVAKNGYSAPEAGAGLTALKAEIDETGHLVVCPDTTKCPTHKGKYGLGTVKLDLRALL